MKCSKCNTDINANMAFCPKCGTKAEETISINNSTIIKNVNKSKYIKIGLICGGIVLLIVLLILLINLFGLKTNLHWNEAYSHYKLEYVMASDVELGIDIDEDKLEDVKISTTCGEAKRTGYSIAWNLKDAKGKCKITVSYKLKKITKEYTIIKYNIGEKDNKKLSMEYEIDDDSNEDLDYDGLTNKQEKEYKTDPESSDSDMDGLDDKIEIITYKTDPNKKDSDSDGLSDYDEIQLGLDPLKKDSKGDGIEDGNRNLTYNYISDDVTINITGTGNIASLTSQISDNTKISSKKGMIDKLYTFHTEGKMKEADIQIKYTDEDLIKYGVSEDNLSLYYYNTSTSTYEKIDTKVDKDNNILTVTLNHFSHYVIGDSTLVNEKTTSQVLFILDNSSSMYSTNSSDKGSDPNGERFNVTANLVTKLDKNNYQLGLSEFRSDYANIYKLGSKNSDIKNKLGTMNGNFVTKSDGTNIANALNKGMAEFTNESDNKYIVILTDGQDSSLKSKVNDIIRSAIDKNIKICSIGFGDSAYNLNLQTISNGTGCKFYSSTDALGLVELFDSLNTELNDNLVDFEGDNKTDGILLADSGFVVNRDGFSFANYASDLAEGHCYGMATFAQLYYKKVLPLSLDSKTFDDGSSSYAYNLNNTYFKNYSNLYQYKLKSEALSYIFGFEYMGLQTPENLRELSDDRLIFSEEHSKAINDSGYLELVEYETTLNEQEQLEKWGVNYKYAQDAKLLEKSMQNSDIDSEDKMLFNAIYASYLKQNTVNHYSSAGDLVLYLRDFLNYENVEKYNGETFVNILMKRLNDSDAPVITSDFSGGLHSVNAISLVQDIDDPNYYYIGVYDNNYPGEKRYVDIKCKKNKCTTVANDYYSKEGEPIRITLSLEDDLEYYLDSYSGGGNHR